MPPRSLSQEHDQAVRVIIKTSTHETSISAYSKVYRIACHRDASTLKVVLLWDDVVAAFKKAVHVRNGTKILPFLMGRDLRKALRFAALLNTTLDVVVEEQSVPEKARSGSTVSKNASNQAPSIPSSDIESSSSTLTSPESIASIPSPSSSTGSSQSASDAEEATPQSIADAYYKIGSTFEKVPERNFQLAMACYIKAAQDDHTSAQHQLGEMFYFGQGVSKDYIKAKEWYLKAAGQGHAPAQYSLGYLFEHGLGVPRNYMQALEWYRKAAGQEHRVAERIEQEQEPYQAMRLHPRNRSSPSSKASIEATEVIHVACHPDSATGKDIVLWDDILVPFKNAAYVRSGTKVLPFLKGADFKNLEPLRIAAVPDTTLDVMTEALSTEVETEPTMASQRSQAAELDNTCLDSAKAQVAAGKLYTEGKGVEQGRMVAMSWFHKAADQGYAEGQYLYGQIHAEYDSHADSHPPDFAVAMKWYRKAAAQKHPMAHCQIGNMYWHGQQDYKEAMVWLLKASSLKCPEADHRIAWMYEDGRGVDKDSVKAREWYVKAAEQGYGADLPHDNAKALEWFLRAAGKDHAMSIDAIGEMHKDGLGVTQDYKAALLWYRMAAAKRYPGALFSVGNAYAYGRGVPQNHKKAMKWYLKAAEGQDMDAQFEIAVMHEEGRGVAVDLSKAFEWYMKAAE
ncbi:hypothetical protein BGW39_011258 [Mortierella sp. 14UC]|nr:hypothetical protein BGW39_011258 [Mortierella sp. 14UC]